MSDAKPAPVAATMLLHFRLEGIEYRVEKWLLAEAIAVQRKTGRTFTEAFEAAETGDMLCLAAIIWIVLKRQDATLAYEDLIELDGARPVDLLSFERISDEDEAPDPEANGDRPSAAGHQTHSGRQNGAASKRKRSQRPPGSGKSSESTGSTSDG